MIAFIIKKKLQEFFLICIFIIYTRILCVYDIIIYVIILSGLNVKKKVF